ncbi:Cyclochlorotine biosynthesis protein O [Lachnellula hyalina]|uniref:Cyclochlorotine biosynthesis protein O n=1 Tax=Lachnellula hyalina TaxID=1316788 RepID=A0A8H8U216_9HELO|nr:Cyclochlorotine biosynthesis protein O [Lachnellula hyalina]TVY28885.1 Cyclochlorotine biosynthesis protein O [Lachnellula hyalina]
MGYHYLKFIQEKTMKQIKGYPADQYSSVRGSSSDDDSKDGLLEKHQDILGPKPSIWRRHKTMIIMQVVILALYSVVMYFVAAKLASNSSTGPDLSHSPAGKAVEWQSKTFVLGDRIQEKSKYSGRPSPAVDKAWHDLLNDENIRIEKEVIEALGRQDISVRIPEDDGFIGTLNVYHELHCIKRLHQYMYEDIYWKGLDDTQREMNRLHNEHCLDFLRQAAICHGDVGIITFQWSPHDRIPVANATTHQCVNWDKLETWTKERSVDMLKPGWLVHPTLGQSFPAGKGDNIGAATGSDSHMHG